MYTDSLEIKLCTSCGSTSIYENYPAAGLSICADCGKDVASIPLKVIQDDMEEELLCKNYVCPHCHTKDDSDDFIESSDTVVLKCNTCGKLDGYKILPTPFLAQDELDEADYSKQAVATAKKEGHLIFSAPVSAKIAKAIQKYEKDPITICQKKVERLLKEKTEKLIDLGVTTKTIEYAKWRTNSYVTKKGPFTDKQLVPLLSAAVILEQDQLSVLNKSPNRVSERKISEALGADRVTTRKWKKLLMEKNSPNLHS